MVERNKYFDILKGIAILGVVAVHYAQLYPFEINSKIRNFFISGQYLVQMFFVISGYFVFLSFSNHNYTFMKFIKSKIISLIPICYISYFITIVLFLFTSRQIQFFDLLFAFSFTNGFSPHFINSIGGWYIGTLVVFYICTPFLFKIITNQKRATVLFLLALLFCLVSDFLLRQFYDTGWFFYFWLPRQFPAISLGILLFYIRKSLNENNSYQTIYEGGGIYV